ncbi:MAG: type IV secretory system conjugative DNA transfer family protein [Fluviibacter phosphoraccumulans]
MLQKIAAAQWRVLFVVVALAATIPFILWFAGMFWLAAIHKNPLGADLWTWLDAWDLVRAGAYPMAEQDRLIRSLFYASLLVYFVPLYVVLNGMLQKHRRALHGNARWANDKEIHKANLVQDDGIVIGRHRDQLLSFPGQQFVLLAAPTRSGKGVGVVIPNLLTYTGSVVVLDIKQENYNITAGYRRDVLQQQTWLFNPFAEDRNPDTGAPAPRTHRYNPLSSITDGVFRVGDILAIGNAIWPTGGKDAFWNDNARNLFLAIVLFLSELNDRRKKDVALPEYPVTMGEVLRQSSGRGTGLSVKKYLQGLVETYPWLSSECLDAMANFLSASDDVLASILSTFNAPLTIWRNPIVDAATSQNDFDLADVRTRPMSVYIGITPDHLEDAKLLVNLIFSQLVNLNTKQLPQDNPSRYRYPCLLLMDEFTAIGKVNILAKAVSYIAGYNLRLLPIIQSMSQLESVYGKEDARTFVTNHALQILFAPREQKDANEYSEMLGTFTEKGISESRSKQILDPKGSSESISDQKRALMLPQELKELGQWKEIVLLENTKPILCDKIRYYDDPVFTSRVKKPPIVASLDLDLFIAKSQKRIRPVQDGEFESESGGLTGAVPEHLMLMEADIDMPPPDSDEGVYDFVTQCYQEQLGMSASDITALVKQEESEQDRPVAELSNWLLNGLEFIQAVEAGVATNDTPEKPKTLGRKGVSHAFSAL